MSSFTPAGSGGLPATPVTVTSLTADTPTVANVAVLLANTEYSYTFPTSTKRYMMANRDSGTLKYSFSSGTSGTQYITLYPGDAAVADLLDTTAGFTVYFQSTKASQTVEILSWV